MRKEENAEYELLIKQMSSEEKKLKVSLMSSTRVSFSSDFMLNSLSKNIESEKIQR